MFLDNGQWRSGCVSVHRNQLCSPVLSHCKTNWKTVIWYETVVIMLILGHFQRPCSKVTLDKAVIFWYCCVGTSCGRYWWSLQFMCSVWGRCCFTRSVFERMDSRSMSTCNEKLNCRSHRSGRQREGYWYRNCAGFKSSPRASLFGTSFLNGGCQGLGAIYWGLI